MPLRCVYRSRTYMASYLLDMPILGTCIRAMGHFEVSFKGTKDGDFSVDREKMAQTQLRVDAHIDSGGMLCFFPEGQLNGNPTEIMVRTPVCRRSVPFLALCLSMIQVLTAVPLPSAAVCSRSGTAESRSR
jgi:1-acyl-sn-glycerol-3-phosphate acyltransferase